MAMDIDPFSMLEVSLQEGPETDEPRYSHGSAGIMHQVENDIQIVQPPPPLPYVGSEVMTPQRAVLSNIQKLASTTKEEEKFRRRAYSSISLVLRKRLHCTICDAHIGAYLGLKDMDIEHPLLKVLACSKCTLKYHYLEFPLNPDGRDIRCRWCTESSKEESPLRYCSYCPFAFCEMCIYRNLPLDELASNKSSWICFVCNVKDLWPSRAVLWALRVLIDTNLALKEEKKWSTDQSTCCKNKTFNKPRRPISLPQNVMQPTNGHNVTMSPRPPVRPVMPMQNNYRSTYVVRAPVQQLYPRPIRPVTVPPPRAAPGSANTQQLYDTSWLTEKVSNISTTLLNLNNNLHRLAQGIPERENKYSIKSKMISMVSLLNISATQLQKASKEMEEESKKILDKNYRLARIQQAAPTPSVMAPQPSGSGVKRPPPSRNVGNRRKVARSDTGSSSEDDPDFTTCSTLPTRAERMKTRACFVKLERLDEKIVEELESDEEVKSGRSSPQPSTSFAPGPLGAVGLCEAPKRGVKSSEKSVVSSEEKNTRHAEENTGSEAVAVEDRNEDEREAAVVEEEKVFSEDVPSVKVEVSEPLAVEGKDYNETAATDEKNGSEALATEEKNDSKVLSTEEKSCSEAVSTEEKNDSEAVAKEEKSDSEVVSTEEKNDSGAVSREEKNDSEAVATEEKNDSEVVSTEEKNASESVSKEENSDSEAVATEDKDEDSEAATSESITDDSEAVADQEKNDSEAAKKGEDSPEAPSPDEAISIAQPDDPVSNDASNEAVPTDVTSEAEPRLDAPSQPSRDDDVDVADSTNADNSTSDNSTSDHSTSESSITDTSTSDTG